LPGLGTRRKHWPRFFFRAPSIVSAQASQRPTTWRTQSTVFALLSPNVFSDWSHKAKIAYGMLHVVRGLPKNALKTTAAAARRTTQFEVSYMRQPADGTWTGAPSWLVSVELIVSSPLFFHITRFRTRHEMCTEETRLPVQGGGCQ